MHSEELIKLMMYLQDKKIESISSFTSFGQAWEIILNHQDAETLILDLIEKNLLSPNQVISDKNKDSKHEKEITGWGLLFRGGYFPIIGKLLEKKIFPKPNDLFYAPSGSPNAWHWLACFRKEARYVMRTLLQNKIYPSSSILSAIDRETYTNTWFWLLANTNSALELINDLLNDNFYPTANDLSLVAKGDYEGTSAWLWLAYLIEMNVSIFEKLINRNIYPRSEDLSQIAISGKLKGTNGWYWLTSQKWGAETIAYLLNCKIYPTAQDLSLSNEIDSQYPGANGWFGLTCNEINIQNFLNLIELKIYPKAKDLSLIIKCGIHAKRKNLDPQNNDQEANGWCRLTSSDKGLEIILKLINVGIIPTAKDLSQKNTIGTSDTFNQIYTSCGWNNLFEAYSKNNNNAYDILNKLNALDILPDEEFIQQNNHKEKIPQFICKKMEFIHQLKVDFNLTDNVAFLIAREKSIENNLILLFLLSFHQITTDQQTSILPFSLIFHIGSYLLPENYNTQKVLKEIYANDANLSYFFRKLMIGKFENYLNQKECLHKQWALNIKNKMEKYSLHTNQVFSKMFNTHYLLFTDPTKKIPKKYISESLDFIKSEDQNDGFLECLKDGVKFSLGTNKFKS